jgi:putative nucleotidyltransferase with HDIG domain
MPATINLDELLYRARKLPAFTETTVRLAQIVSNQGYDVDDVASCVKYDQPLTLKLLSAANSAAYASEDPVGTVYEAVLRLGSSQVLTIAVSREVRSTFQVAFPAYRLEEGELWKHSVATALAGEIAPCYCDLASSPEVFTAALLHDVGKLVMGHFIDNSTFRAISELRVSERLSCIEAEYRVLGISHASLGAYIAENWNLPKSIVDGILYHHDPALGGKDICYLVFLANCVAHRILKASYPNSSACELPRETANYMGVTPKRLDKFCEMAASRFDKFCRLYNAV